MGRQNVWVGAVLAGAATVGVALAAPPATIPPADSPSVADKSSILKVSPGKPTPDGAEMLPKSVSEARSALAKVRDYACFLVRQERVEGVMQLE